MSWYRLVWRRACVKYSAKPRRVTWKFGLAWMKTLGKSLQTGVKWCLANFAVFPKYFGCDFNARLLFILALWWVWWMRDASYATKLRAIYSYILGVWCIWKFIELNWRARNQPVGIRVSRAANSWRSSAGMPLAYSISVSDDSLSTPRKISRLGFCRR